MAENNSMIETQEENSSQKNTQEDADLLAEVQNDDSSLNLGIMRTNQEGITPNFNAEILEYYLQNALLLYEVKRVPIEQLVKQAKSQNQLRILFINLKKAALQTQRYNSCIAGKKVRTNKQVYLQYKPRK